MKFTKSASTSVPVTRSREAIEKMLRRYGAFGFAFAANLEDGTGHVEFILPANHAPGAPRIPVRIPVNVWDVYDRLFGAPKRGGVALARPYPRNAAPITRVEQAERVAWRNLVLWIDAALSAASIGIRSIADTFAGDRLVVTEGGATMRVTELFSVAGGAMPHGARVLALPAGDR